MVRLARRGHLRLLRPWRARSVDTATDHIGAVPLVNRSGCAQDHDNVLGALAEQDDLVTSGQVDAVAHLPPPAAAASPATTRSSNSPSNSGTASVPN